MFFRYVTSALVLVTLTSCVTTNPATGRKEFTIINEQQEFNSFHEVQAQLVKEAGGLYKEKPSLETYMKDRLSDVVRVSERSDKPFRMHVIDHELVNASAIPGHINMYRGILPFFNNEAEMVSVIGHEVGHVTARHTARGQTNAFLAGLLLTAGQLAMANQTNSAKSLDLFNQIGSAGAHIGMASYSRAYEHEADALGVRYMGRLCYDPASAIYVEEMFAKYHDLMDKISAVGGINSPSTIYHQLTKSHPETGKRIAQMRQEMANQNVQCGSLALHTDRYLKQIDGMAYGPKPRDGFGADRRYYNAEQRIMMDVGYGWMFPNISHLPLAINTRGDGYLKVIVKDVDDHQDAEESMMYLLPKTMQVQRFDVKDMDVYTGILDLSASGEQGRVFAIKSSPTSKKVALLVFVTKYHSFDGQDESFKKMARTMKHLTKAQADAIQPMRVKVHTVERGETVYKLAAKMPVGAFHEDWFRVLNNLGPRDTLQNGQKIKIIVNPNK